MKNDIISIMHEISTNEPGLYSGLFGFEGFNILKYKKINWAFMNDEDSLYENIKIFMEYLIFKILSEYGIKTNEKNIIQIDDNKFTNLFTKDYGLFLNQITNFCDLENIDFSIIQTGNFVVLEIKLPIYKI